MMCWCVPMLVIKSERWCGHYQPYFLEIDTLGPISLGILIAFDHSIHMIDQVQVPWVFSINFLYKTRGKMSYVEVETINYTRLNTHIFRRHFDDILIHICQAILVLDGFFWFFNCGRLSSRLSSSGKRISSRVGLHIQVFINGQLFFMKREGSSPLAQSTLWCWHANSSFVYGLKYFAKHESFETTTRIWWLNEMLSTSCFRQEEGPTKPVEMCWKNQRPYYLSGETVFRNPDLPEGKSADV